MTIGSDKIDRKTIETIIPAYEVCPCSDCLGIKANGEYWMDCQCGISKHAEAMARWIARTEIAEAYDRLIETIAREDK